MLRFFFDRFSKVVYALEIIGVLFSAGWVDRILQNPSDRLDSVLVATYLAEYLFLRFCALWRWHPLAKRYEGLELHFKKVMIPTSYILAVFSGIGYFTGAAFPLWLAIALFGIMIYVNITLLYLFRKDKNKTPINYYSGNKF